MGGQHRDGNPSPNLLSDIERAQIQWQRRPEPISLPAETVHATGRTHEDSGTKVKALVPHLVSYTTDIELDAEMIAWKPRAVQLKIAYPDGRTMNAWVWANAVKRIDAASQEDASGMISGR